MAFIELSIDCLLDPYNLIHKFVVVFLKKLQSEPHFGIYDPNEEEPWGLELVEANVL